MKTALPAIRVHIANQQERLAPDFAWLKGLVRTVLGGEGIKSAQINLVLLTDEAIHVLNRRFLEHDEPTDVLTFPMSGPGAKTLEGEVLISTETAERTAGEQGHAAWNEAALYVIHGLLHLCGYDDHAQRDRAEMRQRERHYLAQLGLKLSGEQTF